ncbi:MAG TPA: ABC transporter ATP-binding protein [Desulfonatronum sp.]|nr:ABC transporter ATP-binding protein [Desulfonatronum sp.]
MENPLVAVHGVHFAYNSQPVLEDVHLQIRRGDFLAVLGPNGGGKTTLLKLILGILRPQKGTIRVFGLTPGKAARYVGYVPQHTNVHEVFPITVADVVCLGLLPHRSWWRGFIRSDEAAVRQALERVGMWKHRHQRIGRLSGGQRQRVLIARALVNEPELLFLDEPTASVDRQFQSEFYDLLKTLNASMTIAVVSHDLSVLSSHAKSVACVNKTLFYHDAAELTQGMLESTYHCPVELVTHGPLPHRVLKDHPCRHD